LNIKIEISRYDKNTKQTLMLTLDINAETDHEAIQRAKDLLNSLLEREP
jgi:hypothetical protein